jgi:hypothetical protein
MFAAANLIKKKFPGVNIWHSGQTNFNFLSNKKSLTLPDYFVYNNFRY